MELLTNDLLIKIVINDDLDEVARMWNFEKAVYHYKRHKKQLIICRIITKKIIQDIYTIYALQFLRKEKTV